LTSGSVGSVGSGAGGISVAVVAASVIGSVVVVAAAVSVAYSVTVRALEVSGSFCDTLLHEHSIDINIIADIIFFILLTPLKYEGAVKLPAPVLIQLS
jgi:hypothetical protein